MAAAAASRNFFFPSFCFLLLLLHHSSSSCFSSILASTAPDDDHRTTIRIDCGGSSNFTNDWNESWLSDRFFTGGNAAAVPDASKSTAVQERSLRYFPISQGKKNCYVVDLPAGAYYLRMFFVYDNYDKENHPPSFDVSVEGTIVFSWTPETWTDITSMEGAYSDLFTDIQDNDATVCFYSIGTDVPVIGALEIVQVDPGCYNGTLKRGVIMVNYGRFTGGRHPFGSGFSNDSDVAGRAWDVDTDYTSSRADKKFLTTSHPIHGSDQPPDHFPSRLYQTAHTLPPDRILEYLLPVDPRLDYMLWFHFAEIDPSVSASKERVFDILVNDEPAFERVDIFQAVGKFSAYDLQYTVRNLSNATLSVKFVPLVGAPLISGIENYALLRKDPSTDRNDVLALKALKKSLQVPERMGWNGDPCAPSSWDAWEGVTCNHGMANTDVLTITHLDLSNQGLQGLIDAQVTGLTHLLSLNLSNNLITGTIPEGLGSGLLTEVDLSFNQLTGSIPLSLSSSNMKTVLLNGNQLDGQVPGSLYSIGVSGGYINLSGNAALCGVPSLPPCSVLWGTSQLSGGAKVGIAFAVAVFILIVGSAVYLIIQKRNREDYNFGLPHQLASTSARYQRHKSRLRSESEVSQLARAGLGKLSFSSFGNHM